MTYRFEADSDTEAALRRLRAEAAAQRILTQEAAQRDAAQAWAKQAAHAPLPMQAGAQQSARLAMQRRTNPSFTPEPVHTGASAIEAMRVLNAGSNLSPASGAAVARHAMLRNTRNR